MSLRPPNFWQFYARGVIWSSLVLLPLLFLYNYINSLPYIFPVLTDALETIFALGKLVIRMGCNVSKDCSAVTMTAEQLNFYSYLISSMIYGFVVGIYLAQIWHPPRPKKQDYDY